MARICMVAYTHYRTDSRVRREAEALADRDNLVDFICLADEYPENPEFYCGVRLIKIFVGRYRGSSPIMYIFSYLRFFILASFRLTKLHLKNSYQIVQVHTMPDFMVFVSIIPKMLGAKVLIDVHDLMPELYQSKFGYGQGHPLIRFITWIERLSIRFADKAIAVHKPHLDALSRHGNPSGKFTILLNLPDEKMFTGMPLRTIEKSDFEMIYHGTISERHGLEIAIRAVNHLKVQIPQLRLKIIGGGDDVERLRGLVRELGLQEQVSFSNGMVPLNELVSIIKRADIGIVPILYDEFTQYMLPVKLLEYVRLSIPVICSRTETIHAYFDDSMILYSAPGNVSELADKIFYLYQNPDKRLELARHAERFNREYSWSRQRQIYYQLVDGLISGAVAEGNIVDA